MDKVNLSFLIVGGCFPVQDNISSENLYHAYLSREVKSKYNRCLTVEVVRYERFSDCLGNIKKHNENNPMDILLFHFRSEHFLRLCKLVFRYRSEHNGIKRTLNMLFCSMSRVEDIDYLAYTGATVRSRKPNQNKFYPVLVAANYLLGFLAGNVHFALKRYKKLAADIIEFCKEHEIQVLLAGPASRPHTWWENYLTNTINRYMKKAFDKSGLSYIELLGTEGEDGKSFFFDNGIQVNESGHRRIAKLIIDGMNFLDISE